MSHGSEHPPILTPLGIVRRQSIKNALAHLLGIVVGYFNVLWILPYCLPPGEIGMVRVLVSSASLLASFIPMGMHNIVLRYFPYYEDKRNGHAGFFLLALIVPIGGALIFSFFSYLLRAPIRGIFSENSPEILGYLPYVIPLGLILAYHKVLIAYSRSLLKAVVPMYIKNVALRVLTALAVIFYFLGDYLPQVLVNGYMLAYLLIAAFLAIYIASLGHFKLRPSFFRIPWQKIWEMLKYGTYVMLTAAGGVLVRNVDTIMLGSLAGLTETGVYSIAFFIGTVIEVPKRAVVQISTPLLAKARKNEDLDKVQELYEKTSINHFLLGGLILIGVWASIDDVFRIMPNGDAYTEGKMVVLYIGLAKLIAMLSGINSEIIMTSRFYRFNFVTVLVLAALTILSNFLLIPVMGIEGAALASLISLFLANLLRFFFLWFKEGLQPFTRKTLISLLVLGAILWIGSAMPTTGAPWIDILIRSSVILILFGTMTYTLRLSNDGRDLADQLINKYLRK